MQVYFKCYIMKGSNMNKKSNIPFLLIMIGMVESYIYLFYCINFNRGEMGMSTAEVIAICVALISVAGGIWTQVIQFKKDSGTMNSIKSDTSEIKPTTNNIEKNVKKVRDEVIEKMIPQMSKLEGIDLLVEDYRYREKIKSENSLILNENQLKGSIESIFEHNAALTQKLQQINEENTMLKIRNENLEYENKDLKVRLRVYEREHDRDEELDL